MTDKIIKSKNQDNKYDALSLWTLCDLRNISSVNKSIRLICPIALTHALNSFPGSLSASISLLIYECWKTRKDVVQLLIEKTEITEEFLFYLVSQAEEQEIIGFLGRIDVLPFMIDFIAKHFLEEGKHQRIDLFAALVKNRNCSEETLIRIWSNSEATRVVTLYAIYIPVSIQIEIAQNGSMGHKYRLLNHPSVRQEVKTDLAESLLTSSNHRHVAAAMHYGGLSKSRIYELALSTNTVIAASASDYLTEISSKLRIKEFTRHHFGLSYAPLNAFITDLIGNGMPLGWFVVASKILRKTFMQDPARFLELLKWISQQNRSAGIRQVAWCEDSGLNQFNEILDSIPSASRKKILANSLFAGQLSNYVIWDLVENFNPGYLAQFMQNMRWHRIPDLCALGTELKWNVEQTKLKNFYLRPSRHPFWIWLKFLDNLVVNDAYRIIIPRTAKRIRRIGDSLRNCLGKQEYAETFAKGRTIILAVARSRSILYAIELSPDDGRVIQAQGLYNQEMPNELKDSINQIIKESIHRSREVKP